MIHPLIKSVYEAFTTKKSYPDFRIGDTINVLTNVDKGKRQSYEGVVIAKRNRPMNPSVTVRKVTRGVEIEKVFQLDSPVIDEIKLKRRGKVRRAKLYYLRSLSAKKSRIKERIVKKESQKA